MAGQSEVALAPKTNGLLKPVGIGIRGPACNEDSELIGEADVVVTAADATFADTSLIQSHTPLHAFILKRSGSIRERSRNAFFGDWSTCRAPVPANLKSLTNSAQTANSRLSLTSASRSTSI
jgi:hypothetical protein